MIKRKYCKIYSILMLAVISVCSLILGFVLLGNAGSVSAEGPVFDDEVTFREDYGVGYTL